MRYPIKDKFWGWRMDPFEVFAYWDSRRTSLNWHWHWVLVAGPTATHNSPFLAQQWP